MGVRWGSRSAQVAVHGTAVGSAASGTPLLGQLPVSACVPASPRGQRHPSGHIREWSRACAVQASPGDPQARRWAFLPEAQSNLGLGAEWINAEGGSDASDIRR